MDQNNPPPQGAPQSKPSLIEVVREGFFQTLGKITVTREAAEGAVTRTLNRLVELGKMTQEEARHFTSDVKNRIEKNRLDLERRIDESVSQAMMAVRFPNREELEVLRERIAHLEQIVQDLATKEASTKH